MPFCSTYCIDVAKNNPYITKRQVTPSDWDEQGHIENGKYTNWKIERKINRPTRPKHRKNHITL